MLDIRDRRKVGRCCEGIEEKGKKGQNNGMEGKDGYRDALRERRTSGRSLSPVKKKKGHKIKTPVSSNKRGKKNLYLILGNMGGVRGNCSIWEGKGNMGPGEKFSQGEASIRFSPLAKSKMKFASKSKKDPESSRKTGVGGLELLPLPERTTSKIEKEGKLH